MPDQPNSSPLRDDVFLDSGCGDHCFNDQAWFSSFVDTGVPEYMMVGNGQRMETRGRGTVVLPIQGGNIILENVRYCPKVAANLVSTGILRGKGIVVDGCHDQLMMKSTGQVICPVIWRNNISIIECSKPQPRLNLTPLLAEKENPIPEMVEYGIMHRRLAHASPARVLRACQKADIRIDPKSFEDFHCEACHQVKANSLISREGSPSTTAPLQYIFWDLIEHTPVGYSGYHYSLHAIDASTNHHWVMFLKTKDEVLTKVKGWKARVEKNRSDDLKCQIFGFNDANEHAKEMRTEEFETWAAQEGLLVPSISAPNSRLERAARAIIERAQAVCIETGLPESLWPLLLHISVYVANRLPSLLNEMEQTPMEALSEALGMPYVEDIRDIRTWGCDAYVQVLESRRKRENLEPRVFKGQLVGMEGHQSHVLRIWLPDQQRVVRARNVHSSRENGTMGEGEQELEYEARLVDA